METSWTLPVQKHKFSDLYLCFCGYEACQPLHSYGPAVRPNSVIHYIISGKGTFTIGNRTYRLTAGQGFFAVKTDPEICPGIIRIGFVVGADIWHQEKALSGG